jgi:3-deoxy-D-manno-octulosonic-acid transferase
VIVRENPRVHLFYGLVLGLWSVLALPVYLWRGRGKHFQTLRERMGRLPPELGKTGERSIWVHAVSVGEVLASRPLVRALKERFPSHRVFLSTTTLTGNAIAKKDTRGVDGLFFAPFDWPRPVRVALAALNPVLLVLVETEIWPNLIHEARRRGTRVAVVNGRISPRSFSRYRRIRAFMRLVLAEVDLFLMQGEAHAQRIKELGAPPERVRVVGNLKFDSLDAPLAPEPLARLVRGDGGPVFVAGSTAEGEEEMVLKAFQRIRADLPEARLVVAPRHPERFQQVPAIIEAAGFQCVKRSSPPLGFPAGAVVLLDTLGELAQVYPLASVVFVGGSLVPSGGHNILEAAVAGKPVVVGPHMENFQEIADLFRSEGALLEVTSSEELASEVLNLLKDEVRRRTLGEKARRLVERNRGSVRGTLEALAGLVA